MSRQLIRDEGLLCGSSGSSAGGRTALRGPPGRLHPQLHVSHAALLLIALRWCSSETTIVMEFSPGPDKWMCEKGFLIPEAPVEPEPW